uniref:Uncharacterized protein n=1 Tax=Oryza nivara TaxID=4536 RepID=A0A0E0IFC2_ORYNI
MAVEITRESQTEMASKLDDLESKLGKEMRQQQLMNLTANDEADSSYGIKNYLGFERGDKIKAA